jgi:hypothetical protein
MGSRRARQVAIPLAKLIDVALERERVAQQAAEAEATAAPTSQRPKFR